ncbi:hypothetical protein [Ornithinimicrobium sp. Y1694]|uniref:HNH endonuclease signature motif containing protein n=1 Tax=Ornithinimicrobium sp. Y1694 TaxID=3418590 RepID=UPI003CF39580
MERPEAIHPTMVAVLEGYGAIRQAEAELITSLGCAYDETLDRVLEAHDKIGVELSATACARLHSEARSALVGELECGPGERTYDARTLVSIATTGEELRVLLVRAMVRGEASLTQVMTSWTATASLTFEQRLLVAHALYGPDPVAAARERLGADGEFHGHPWTYADHEAALDREVTACRASDVDSERKRRLRAYNDRYTRTRVNDDGTATMTIRGPAPIVLSAGQRIDLATKTLKTTRDQRTRPQARADIALTILTYATIGELEAFRDAEGTTEERATEGTGTGFSTHGADAPGASENNRSDSNGSDSPGLFDPVIAPDEADLLARIINAAPPVALQVIVPHDALGLGFPVCMACSGPIGSTPPPEGTAPDPHPETVDDPHPETAADPHAEPGPQEAPPRSRATATSPLPRPSHNSPPPGHDRTVRGKVGEIIGANAAFISGGLARELALTPGTILHRLLTDPADGRLKERSIPSYRPDAAMRLQVRAADLYSRYPGSRAPASQCEIDHVTPFGWGSGETGEHNLQLLNLPPHHRKTAGNLAAAINAARDVTFTTLLGQVRTTRVHDYSQYARAISSEDLAETRDRAAQLIYAIYAHHSVQKDRPDPASGITVGHITPDGEVRMGPRFATPSPEALIKDWALKQDPDQGGADAA